MEHDRHLLHLLSRQRVYRIIAEQFQWITDIQHVVGKPQVSWADHFGADAAHNR